MKKTGTQHKLDAISHKKYSLNAIIERLHFPYPDFFASLLCLFWLITKIISYKLWGRHPLFPLIPVLDMLSMIPSEVNYILYYFSIGLLLIIIIKPQLKWLYILLLISEICSCILDQNRWRAFEYEFLFFILILLVYQKDELLIRKSMMVILACTYLYSGLHKMNSGFVKNIWGEMILKSFLKIPHNIIHQPLLLKAGYLLAFFEALAGLGLLLSATKVRSAQFLILMHLFNLLLLGPFGINYNIIVLPWNIVNCLFLYILFINGKTTVFSANWILKGMNPIILLCWGILPSLNFWGLWDNYLSCKLYSGNLQQMVICIFDTTTTTAMKPYYNHHDNGEICHGGQSVSVRFWALREIDAPEYPEKRVYQKIKKYFLLRYPASQPKFYLIDASRSRTEL